MNEQLLNRIRQCPALPTLPAVAVRVLEAAQDPDVDIAGIARLIGKDPALSSKILRTVNSSFYGCSYNISTVSHALVLMGLQSVKTLVLGFSLVHNLSQNKPNSFDHLTYWRRSIYSATASRLIAVRIGLVQQEEAFLATLLNDIGMLVLDQVLGEEYGHVCSQAKTHHDLPDLEQAVLRLTHAEVGGMLAQDWKLPPLLTTPISFHHRPDQVEDEELRRIAWLICLSGWCADVFVEKNAAPAITRVRAMAEEQFDLSNDAVDELLAEVGEKTREVASLFEISIGSVADYEAILKRANDALLAMTLQPDALPQANPATAATMPAAGGVVSGGSGSLPDLLRPLMTVAQSQNRPLALLLIGPDHLPRICAARGQQGQQEVMKWAEKLLRAVLRPCDRYIAHGNDAGALILVGNNRSGAAGTAETLRRAIAARPVPMGSMAVSMSASIGLAMFDPAGPLRESEHLIKAATMALTAARQAGGNCVRVFSLKPGESNPSAAA